LYILVFLVIFILRVFLYKSFLKITDISILKHYPIHFTTTNQGGN
jgi:hypothetical protein